MLENGDVHIIGLRSRSFQQKTQGSHVEMRLGEQLLNKVGKTCETPMKSSIAETFVKSSQDETSVPQKSAEVLQMTLQLVPTTFGRQVLAGPEKHVQTAVFKQEKSRTHANGTRTRPVNVCSASFLQKTSSTSVCGVRLRYLAQMLKTSGNCGIHGRCARRTRESSPDES